MGKIYRRTAAGQTAFMVDSAMAMEHRLLLAVLEVATPSTHFPALLPSYPEAQIREWLAELSRQGLVQASPAAGG
ncbi:MAG: hypothetical protein ACT4P4_02745 [Betaproteobacteria bacterium]